MIRRQMGGAFLYKLVEGTKEYKASVFDADKKPIKDGMLAQVLAIGFLQNSDYGKYGRMYQTLHDHYANGRLAYPSTLTTA